MKAATAIAPFPYVQLVADILDITLISDMQEPSEHASPCPAVDGESAEFGEECLCSPVTVYYLGELEDLGAGIRGGAITPAFADLQKLEEFCIRNWDKFNQAAKEETVPDATNWD